MAVDSAGAAAVAALLEFAVQDGDVMAAFVPPLGQVGQMRVEAPIPVEGFGDQVIGAFGLGEAACGFAVYGQLPRDLAYPVPVGLQGFHRLVYPGFVAASGMRRLPDIARYLRGIEARLSKLEAQPQRDRDRLLKLDEVLAEYADYQRTVKPGRPGWDTLQQVRWMIEELRISTFAQELGTAYPVSDVRIYRTLASIG